MPLLSTRGAASARGFGLLGRVKAIADPFFNYVTMLLHGDGTNGGQNNTFLDSSTNNFTITRNGNTTQGSFSPYGPNWSNYFDGTGDYLATPSAFAIGSNDFTYEVFLFATSFPGYTQKIVTGSGNNLNFSLTGTGDVRFFDGIGNYTCGTITLNTWNHVAVSRVGGTLNLYVNGTRNYSSSNAASQSAQILYIGAESGGTSGYFGYISNLRLIVGTGLYSAATITVPTSALTAVSGTQLLTCQSNRFRDASTNNFVITVFGNTSVQRFSPFAPPAEYSTATIGGSGYFDGAGDYLTAPATGSAFDISTGNFTIEAWHYMNGSVNGTISALNKGSGVDGLYFVHVGGIYVTSNSSSWDIISLGSIPGIAANCWQHVALVRNGNNWTVYLNGVSVHSVTSSASISFSGGTRLFGVGATGGGSALLNGNIAGFRLTKSAVYTSTFTPPAAPLTAITNTSFLCNFTNAAIFDNAMMNNLETVGNAQISTSVVKYGTGSIAFDGNGDYLVPNVPTSDLYAFGAGDFTVEFWVYANSFSGGPIFLDWRPNGVNGVYPTLYFTSGGVMTYFTNSADRITSSALSTGIWYHVAVCRSGTSTRMFVNGTQAGSTYTDSNSYLCPAARPVIAASGSSFGSSGFNGYIDDFRITKGVARYTANFTPPTAAFPNN